MVHISSPTMYQYLPTTNSLQKRMEMKHWTKVFYLTQQAIPVPVLQGIRTYMLELNTFH